MSSPDADEPHAIADTQMFRRFVNEEPPARTEPEQFWMWRWPGLLIPTISAIIVVAIVIILVTN